MDARVKPAHDAQCVAAMRAVLLAPFDATSFAKCACREAGPFA